MIRAGVDDREMARGVGIPVSRLFTAVFFLGAALAGLRRRDRRADPVRLSRARRRHAAAGAGRGDPRRRRQPARRAGRQPSSWASSTISAPRCSRTSPTSCCSCRWWSCWCSSRRACSAGCRHDAARSRSAARGGRCCCGAAAGASATRSISASRRQVLVFAVLALSLNILLGYGGMTSLGPRRLSRRAGLCLRAADRPRARRLVAALGALLAPARCWRRCSACWRCARAGLGFLMITLALGQIVWGMAYRWVELTGGDNGAAAAGAPDAVRHRHLRPGCRSTTSRRRVRDRAAVPVAARALAVRRLPARHARPAAADAHARPQRLADPLDRVRAGGVLGLGRRAALRLRLRVRQSRRAVAAAIGRDAADGDPGRRRHAGGAGGGRGDHHPGAARGQHLCRPLVCAARRDLHPGGAVHAAGDRAGLRSSGAAASAAERAAA